MNLARQSVIIQGGIYRIVFHYKLKRGLTSSTGFCTGCCCCCMIAPDAFGIDVAADKVFKLLLALMLLLLLLLYTDVDDGGWLLLAKVSSNKLGILGNVCCVLLAFHLLVSQWKFKTYNERNWLNLQWRLLGTPVRVGRRPLQRRVFWHKIQNIIFP